MEVTQFLIVQKCLNVTNVLIHNCYTTFLFLLFPFSILSLFLIFSSHICSSVVRQCESITLALDSRPIKLYIAFNPLQESEMWKSSQAGCVDVKAVNLCKVSHVECAACNDVKDKFFFYENCFSFNIIRIMTVITMAHKGAKSLLNKCWQ